MATTIQHKDLTGEDLHDNKVYPETNTELSAGSLVALDARYINESQAAGGDIAGTYPNPTVVWPNSFQTLDSRYYTESESDTLLASKQDSLGFTPINKAGDTLTGQLQVPAESFSTSNVPIRFRYPNMSDDESSKGGIIEWGGDMDAEMSYAYGIATQAYIDDPLASFTVSSSGYKKWAWITAHYDSPSSTGEGVHQHLNLETVKADWLTCVTRIQVSFGEDVALVSFPNSHIKVYNDLNFQIGTDAEGAVLRHNTSLARIVVSGSTPWNFSSSSIKIGPVGAPASRLHVENSTDAVVLTLKNTMVGANGSALVLMHGTTAGATAVQAGLSGESTNRFSMNTSGRMEWGSGSATRDTNLYRSGADVLKTDDSFEIGAALRFSSALNTTPVGTAAGRLPVILNGTTYYLQLFNA